MQGPIRHTTNQGLFDYWLGRRDGRRAPSRTDIEPADIHTHLPDTFILQANPPLPARFRLAGSRICTLFNREMKDTNLVDLWDPVDADTLAAAIRIMREDASCCVVRWKGFTARDNNVAGEMLLTPLTMGGGDIVRILGALALFDLPYWLGTDPVVNLRLKAINMVEPGGDAQIASVSRAPLLHAHPGPAIPGARRVAHLVVVEGGRPQE